MNGYDVMNELGAWMNVLVSSMGLLLHESAASPGARVPYAILRGTDTLTVLRRPGQQEHACVHSTTP